MAFYLHKENIYGVPIVHYHMEMAAQVKLAFEELKPDCVAVELAETMQLQHLHAASRLPDISIVLAFNKKKEPIYYLSEPCDPAYEGLRSAIENDLPAYCIDLDVDDYPDLFERIPDPYSISRIGMEAFYQSYERIILKTTKKSAIDRKREQFMAQRLKELGLRYDKVLFIGGMYHVQSVLDMIDMVPFRNLKHAERDIVQICALSEESIREVMAEMPWITIHYEHMRSQYIDAPRKEDINFPPDRQKLIYNLYKQSSKNYIEKTGNAFPGYHMRNLMKFVRNYSLLQEKLLPDLFQILSAAKGCVDHNYAYYTWELATDYPFPHNVDNLPELDLSVEELWGQEKTIKFHLKEKSRKWNFMQRKKKETKKYRFQALSPFSICSYQPEDGVIEHFGEFLKKKGTQILTEENARTVPFTTSIEDGIDTRETIRHWAEKKIYVKVRGKPPGGVGSVIVIFDEDQPEEGEKTQEKYPWKTTWLGEHEQESDMAFFATPPTENMIGPGISKCEYGGFLMSYPPRRMFDVWSDPDYEECRSKSEVLLVAGIDYAVQPTVVYVAAKPPRSMVKSFAARFNKRIVYIPIGQLSPVTLNKIRAFHVLDGHDKRSIADEYIF